MIPKNGPRYLIVIQKFVSWFFVEYNKCSGENAILWTSKEGIDPLIIDVHDFGKEIWCFDLFALIWLPILPNNCCLSGSLIVIVSQEVLVRFSGFGSEEDEWVNIRRNIRPRSLPCESSECVAVLPGDLILCFQVNTFTPPNFQYLKGRPFHHLAISSGQSLGCNFRLPCKTTPLVGGHNDLSNF